MSTDANPYESPRAADTMGLPPAATDGFRRFKVRLFPFWIGAIIATLFTLGPMAPFLVPEDLRADAFTGVVVLVGCAVQTIAICCLVEWYPVYLSRDGLRCCNVWGKYQYLEWAEISRVGQNNLLGFRCFLLYAGRLRRPLWLPRYLAKSNEFFTMLLPLLDPASPLATAIREAGLTD